MSTPIQTQVPDRRFAMRGAAICGVLAAVVLLVNAAKRGGVLPETDLTQLVAPAAEIFAVFLVVGIYLRSARRDRLAQVALGANVAALSALVGVEIVINLVFAQLPGETVTALRDGPLGLALTLVSVLFLIASLLFTYAMGRDNSVPRVPLAAYAVAAVPIALRAFVPEWALDAGLALLALAVGWLALWLYRAAGAVRSAVG